MAKRNIYIRGSDSYRAYEEGYTAKLSGKGQWDNPYGNLSHEHAAWNLGWLDAA